MNNLRHTIHRQLAPMVMAAAILAFPVAGSADSHDGSKATTILKSVPQPKFWDLVFESMTIYENPISGEPLYKYHPSGTAYIELGSSIQINCKYRMEADISLAESDLPQWNRPNVQFLTQIEIYKKNGDSTADIVRQALPKNSLPQLAGGSEELFKTGRFSLVARANLGPVTLEQIGTYYARCETDGYHDIAESNESNNQSGSIQEARFVVHDNSFPADAFKAQIAKPETGYVQEQGYMIEFGVNPLNYDYRPDRVDLRVERYDQSARSWSHVWSHQMTEPPASHAVDFSPLGDGFYRVQVQARSTKVQEFGVVSFTPYNHFWIGKPTVSTEVAAGLIQARPSDGPDLVIEKFWSETANGLDWYMVWLVRNIGTEHSDQSRLKVKCRTPSAEFPSCPFGAEAMFDIPQLAPRNEQIPPLQDVASGQVVWGGKTFRKTDKFAQFDFAATVDFENVIDETIELNNVHFSSFKSDSSSSVAPKAAMQMTGNAAITPQQPSQSQKSLIDRLAAYQRDIASQKKGAPVVNLARQSTPSPGQVHTKEGNRQAAKSTTKTVKRIATLPPALKVDRILVRAQARAGQPANLSVQLRNTSQTTSKAGQQLLSITCKAPKDQTCKVLSRSLRVTHGIAPGKVREQNLAGAIIPSGPGTYKVTVVPKGAPRSAGMTASVLVAKTSGLTQTPTQVIKAPPVLKTVPASKPPTVPIQKLNNTLLKTK